MPRRARIIVPGYAYHVTQRGNRGQAVFRTDEDRIRYLNLLARYSRRYGLSVWSYCLMTNHVHFTVRGDEPFSLSRGIGITQMCYTQWFNKRYGLSGHLWTSRYYSTPLDEHHLWCAVRYVELNPVRARMVQRPEDYPWSSARAHVRKVPDPVLSPSRPFPGAMNEWAAFLATGLTPEEETRIRRNTYRGLPSGSGEFVSQLEVKLSCSLVLRPRGRPRKL